MSVMNVSSEQENEPIAGKSVWTTQPVMSATRGAVRNPLRVTYWKPLYVKRGSYLSTSAPDETKRSVWNSAPVAQTACEAV